MLYRRNFGTEMGTVCWDVVMRGLSCEGVHAKSPADVESALAKARDVAGPLRDGRGVERARASARGWWWWRGSGYKVTITEVDAQPVGRSTGCTQAARRSHTRIASRRAACTVRPLALAVVSICFHISSGNRTDRGRVPPTSKSLLGRPRPTCTTMPSLAMRAA